MAERLPVEVVSHILQFLNVSDRKDASLVNRTWYEASRAPSLLQDVVFLVSRNENVAPGIRTAATTQRRNPHLVLETLNAQSRMFQNCEQLCAGLQSLSVRGTDISEAMLIRLLSHCDALESLDLSCCNSLFMTGMLLSKADDVERLRKQLGATLRSLNLSSIRYLSDATFNRVVSIAPHLRQVSLAGCQIMFHTRVYSGSGVMADGCNNTAVLTFKNVAHFIHTRAAHLQALDFSRTRVNDEALEFMAETPRLQLRELLLASCRDISDAGLVKLSKKQVTLTHIDLSECVDLTDAALHALVSHLSRLKMLRMSKCRQVTDAAVLRLSKLLHLQELDLSSCYSLTSPGLVRGLCPPAGPASPPRALVHLNLSCCSGINDSFVTALCQALPGLLHLDLGSCYSIHDESVHAISRHLVHLRFLRLAWCKEVSDYALLGVPNPDSKTSQNDANTTTTTNPGVKSEKGPIRRQPSKIFGDLASLLPDPPPAELSEATVESLKSTQAHQAGAVYPISHLQQLRVLDLSALPQLTDASVKDAVRFRGLQELRLEMSPGITDAALFAIGLHLPSVEVLNLSRCRRITDEGLIYVILRLHRLRSLNVSGCDTLTDASMEALGSHAPYLRLLDVSLCGGIRPQAVEKLEHTMKHLTCVKKRLVGGCDGGN